MPFVVVATFVLALVTGAGRPSTAKSRGPLPELSYSAPPHAAAEAGPCAKLLALLPVTLKGLDQRAVHVTPESPDVVAWGDPAVVLRCGVERPTDLRAGSGTPYFIVGGTEAGPYYDQVASGDDDVFTTVDRAVYISISVPRRYATGPVGPLSQLIAKALPPVCLVQNTDGTVPDSKLCTRRP